MTTDTRTEDRRPARRRRRGPDAVHLLFLLPAVVAFSLALTVPAVMG
ncbi:sugar ABC transporter permease, partial [Geobacillus sp. MMMUD3]|nr:sugar ABC transporter permease [Geobacillus sp. MMMUD3]